MNPPDVEHPAIVRSFKLRTGRLGPLAAEAHSRQWPLIGVDIPRNTKGESYPTLDLDALFGTSAPIVMEIGFGMGIATAEMAEADPSTSLLAIDVHAPGIAALCRQVEERSIPNLRIAKGDVMDLMRDHLAPESLSGARIFFPDPWPKKKHQKRRLISAEFLDLLSGVLRPGSVVHFATDWAEYGEHTLEVFDAHPAFARIDAVPSRPTTGYERAGIRAGRSSQDFAFERL